MIADVVLPASIDIPVPIKNDKRRIAETFGRAAPTYDAAATLQKRVAARARLGLPEQAGEILDMGCGTGQETVALRQRYPLAALTGLDLSEGMLSFASGRSELANCRWINGDIEELPFTVGEFDLVFSSLAVQWCENLSEVLAQVHSILKPGGSFVFSTLAAGSLKELKTAWTSVDDQSHVNRYEGFPYQKRRVENSGFEVISLRQQAEVLYYPSVIHLLREMKALGANTVVENERKGLAGRKTLKALQQGYQPFQQEQGLPATYQVVYGVLRKPV